MIGVYTAWDWLSNTNRRRGVAGHVVSESGCWDWAGAYDRDGYGQVHTNYECKKAHRVAYEHFTAEKIPPEIVIDHKCRNHRCVNPHHLRLVTPGQNSSENSNGVGAINAAKTYCLHGHAFTDENTYIWKPLNGQPKRHCRACGRAKGRRWYARHKRGAR